MPSSLSELILSKENIVHIGALLYLAGFLFRNQIVLRSLIVAGDIVYIAYFFLAPATPLWGGIFWSLVFLSVNLFMIGLIVMEQKHFSLTARERRLFDILQDLAPGQFRALLKVAKQGEADVPMVITEEGKPLDRLYFVLSGRIGIEKAGRHAEIGAETFIGEVAFLLGRPASATVTLLPGCAYFVWESAELKKVMAAKPALGSALTAAMNRNLAGKVASSEVAGTRVRNPEPEFNP